jgi:hypothetical protein
MARCAYSIGCSSEARFDASHNTVRLRPLLDRIPFDDWNRFYHQDAPSSLQARRVGDSPNLGPSPPLHQVSFLLYSPIAHATVRILPGKNASRHFPPRFSDAVILIFNVNQPETLRTLNRWWSKFCACAPLGDNETEDYLMSRGGRKQDRSRVQFRRSCGLGRSCLGLHRRTRPAIGVSIQ